MNLAYLLANAAGTFGERPAITVGDALVANYAELAHAAASRASGLRALPGVRPGDKVVLAMYNRPFYLELLFAIWHAGLVAVPVNAKLHPREIAFIIADTQARLCLAGEELAHGIALVVQDRPGSPIVLSVDDAEFDRVRGEPMAMADVGRDDLAWIFYTSGTTGNPKGAMLSHQNLQLMAWSYLCDFDQLSEKDALIHTGPQSHAAGLIALSHVAKASRHIVPPSGGFDAQEVVSLINLQPDVTFFGAPTMLKRLCETPSLQGARIEHVRTILGGAAPFTLQDVRSVLDVFGPRFSNAYGQGECPCTIAAMPKHFYAQDLSDDQLVSVGIARTGVEIRILDKNGRPLAAGETGEIAVRSDIVMRGYLNNAEATAAAVIDGWLHTGDLGSLDDRGILALRDRSKDLIISGGTNIYPTEIEQVLLRHPAVQDVAVVGLPDAEWGESVAAFVVLRAGQHVDSAVLDGFCLESLARFKRPKDYRFLAELPRNATGKILKTELRKLAH